MSASVGLVTSADARAAKTRSCPSFTATHTPSGEKHRVSAFRVVTVSCGTGRTVVRSFYRQLLGSSGATIARGYGCAYTDGGVRVRCTRGGRVVRWTER